MSDITERLRHAATIHVQLAGQSALATTIRDGADEIDRLRARLNTAGHAHLDGAHLSGKADGCLLCEAMTERETLRARVAELEAAKGEPVAYLHQVVCGDGEPDQALSFAPDNFPLAGVLGYRSLSHVPLYTAPRVDVDAISDGRIQSGSEAYFAECLRLGVMGEQSADRYMRCMRAALRAIFNDAAMAKDGA